MRDWKRSLFIIVLPGTRYLLRVISFTSTSGSIVASLPLEFTALMCIIILRAAVLEFKFKI